MIATGTRVGPYRITRSLGAGAMGEVYLGFDDRLGRHVAIKVLPAGLALDPERLERFRREAIALAAVHHPNIAAVYGIENMDGGEPCIVLERIDGETLGARLENGPLATGDALRFVAQAAEGLEAAHAAGVVHRDLHPNNLMIDVHGRVRILDFGVAKIGDEPSRTLSTAPVLDPGVLAARESTLRTEAGTVFGTPGYMSPEQASGGVVDERTDLFALGCVLYESLTGRPAFDGVTPFERLTSVLYSDPDLDALPATTPGRVRAVIGSCLARDRTARPPSARALRLILEEALGIAAASAIREGRSDAFQHNLPPERTRLVGRASVLAECERLLERARLFTLTGPGGSGKTRIALRLAADCVAEHPGGAWFVDLASTSDAARVPFAVAAALGIRETGDSMAAAVTAAIARRPRTLIVLDNCEHVLAACVTLVHELLAAAPEVRIVATSRERLAVAGEQVYAVPTLAVPPRGMAPDIATTEAVELFVERAGAVVPGFALADESAGVVAEICRRVDGMPLAIELAAARVRVMSPREILAALDDRFRLLTGGSAAEPRHATLLATLEWSHDLLTDEERSALRALSVFSGGWTLRAATEVWGAARDAFHALDVLARLADRSMIVVETTPRGETRYRMLETVRAFALLRATQHGEIDAARDRHLAFFAAASEAWYVEMRTRQSEALEHVAPDYDNVLAALDWAAASPARHQDELRIAGTMWHYWAHRGLVRAGARLLLRALEHDVSARPSMERARALNGAAYLSHTLGDRDAARRLYRELLGLAEAADLRTMAAGARLGLGFVAQADGDLTTAEIEMEASRAIGEACDDARSQLLACENLGVLLFFKQDWARSLQLLDDSVQLARRLDDQGSLASGLNNLGTVALRAGDLARARRTLLEAARVMRTLGPAPFTLAGLETVVELAIAEERFEIAGRVLSAVRAQREASGVYEQLADERDLADQLMARIAAHLGDAAWQRIHEDGRRLKISEALDDAVAWLADDDAGIPRT